MYYPHLNAYTVPGSTGYNDAWSRVLSRLGEYTGMIMRALNMRPAEVSLLAQTHAHILVRVSSPGEHLVLRIAPEGHLIREVFFGRTMAQHHLPAAPIVYADLKRSVVPFDYTLERYICGVGAHQIDSRAPHLLRPAARQAGRILRRMHRVAMPGWGMPSAAGRWLIPDWPAVLAYLHETQSPLSTAALVFDEAQQQAIAAALEHLAALDVQPRLVHGAFAPQSTRYTIGEHIQLEAFVDPGSVVAGDGLLDLAWGLSPAYPDDWRAGLLAGYAAVTPLSAAEQQRLRLLRLLTCYWSTCQRYARAEPHEQTYAQVLALLEGEDT